MTYAEALNTTTAKIKEHLVNSADSLELVCFVLGITREKYYSTPSNTELNEEQVNQLKNVIRDYNQSKPLAYITGKTEFFGNEIIVKPGVLIPRPETELLVEKFLADLANTSEINILEIGTGSGCIITSIAKSLKAKGVKFSIVGIDPSPIAFEVTCTNIEQNLGIRLSQDKDQRGYADNQIRIKIINKPIQDYRQDDLPTHIISNPPYITSAEMADLDTSVKDFEPELALNGGNEGLDIYKEIVSYAKALPQLPRLYLEISPLIADDVEELFQEAGNKTIVELDQFERQRFLLGK